METARSRKIDVAHVPVLRRPAWFRASIEQIGISDQLHVPRLSLKTVRAYHMRLNSQDIWALTTRTAERFLEDWCGWVARIRLDPMVRVATTIRDHWDGVLRWFETHISNGVMEGINSPIRR
jgi:transposase